MTPQVSLIIHPGDRVATHADVTALRLGTPYGHEVSLILASAMTTGEKVAFLRDLAEKASDLADAVEQGASFAEVRP